MVGRHVTYDDHKLFVGNLVDTATTDDLDSLFSKYGKVTNVWVARKPPGFAFVVRAQTFHFFQTFDDPRDAKDALQELNGKEFQGNSLRIERCRERPPRRRNTRDPYTRGNPRRKPSRSRSRSSGRRVRSRSPSYGKARSRS